MKSDIIKYLQHLSPLEIEMARILQDQAWYGTKDLYAKLRKKRAIATTSVSVLLDRLHQKGLLTRKSETCRGGTRFVYRLQIDQLTYERKVMDSVVDRMIKKFGDNALNYFHERFSKKM